jgi:putative inorganic carbon (HCO3(-)) transporter
LRVFSTLNAPGTAAFFFVFVVLIGLHKLDLRRPGPMFCIIVCVASLMLTNVRAAWVALALGIIVYLLIAPRRGRAFIAVSVISIVTVLLALNASTLLGYKDVTTQLVARLSTLSDVDSDASVNDRQRESAVAMHNAIAEPLGQGLGTVGTSTKLGGGGQLTLDNGYLSRFVEMGVAGVAGYLVALGSGIFFAFRALLEAGARKDGGLAEIAATAVCVQVTMLGFDLSVDAHSALPGLVFWVLLGLTLRQEDVKDDGWDELPEVEPTPDPREAAAPLWA